MKTFQIWFKNGRYVECGPLENSNATELENGLLSSMASSSPYTIGRRADSHIVVNGGDISHFYATNVVPVQTAGDPANN